MTSTRMVQRLWRTKMGEATRGRPVKAFTFGRDRTKCTVHIDDEYASPMHCRAVQYEDGSVLVQDLGSTNGTWIGGDRVDSTLVLLEPGETLVIGRTMLPWRATP